MELVRQNRLKICCIELRMGSSPIGSTIVSLDNVYKCGCSSMVESLPSKQVVASSSLVSHSKCLVNTEYGAHKITKLVTCAWVPSSFN